MTKRAAVAAIPEATVGELVVAKHTKVGTLIVPSPRKEDFDDLVLLPWEFQVVDERWLNVPRFKKHVKDGDIEWQRTDDYPLTGKLQLAPEFDSVLDAHLKQVALTICEVPLDAQLKGVINIHKQVNDHGITASGSKVTKEYLKLTHLPFLKAIRELEMRWQKRKDVLREVNAAITRIEGL